ncbi:MAG: ribose-phosphate pyrophosphokinase [Proteobacteria bacterium]|nr:MAG: ribose-phosphate pyrophosphokinase [Pseudomonadota bacterium]
MKPLYFWTQHYQGLGAEIAGINSGDTGKIESKIFPDGERYLRVLTEVRERDVVLIGGTVDDRETLDVFDLACAISAYGAKSLKIVIPFYGYATMERAVRVGEVVTAKTRARIFSSIPIAPFGNQILLLDLHSEGIPHYFEGPVKTRHLYAKEVILREAKLLGGSNFVLGSVDAGRAKWVESLANDLGVEAGFVYKRRAQNGEVSLAGVNVSVDGRDVVIYDDMIRSGGSLIQAAQAYKDQGAKKISALTTHGVFTDGAIEKLKKSGLFEKIVSTNSHPNAVRINESAATPFLKVVSVAEVFASALSPRS